MDDLKSGKLPIILKGLLTLAIFLLIIQSTYSNPKKDSTDFISTDLNTLTKSQLIDSVIEYGKLYLGKPYRYKDKSNWVMDCSGFVSYIFAKYGVSLPHSSQEISSQTEAIDVSGVQKGDLLFFKGRNISSGSIGHVSVVADASDGNITMMHSCRRGIILEKYPAPYYTERFVKAGRIAALTTEESADSIPATDSDLEEEGNKSEETSVAPDNETVNIIGVGDMMLGTNYPSSAYLPPNDGKDILTPVKDILIDADVTFGNMEGAILTGKGQPKSCKDSTKCYIFKSPDHYVNYFKEAGFDVVSIANNHVGDFGETGRQNTSRLLNENEINFAGLETKPFTTFERNGVKYGFCAFSPNKGTVRITDLDNAKKIVQHLDSICDIVIVSFHGGAEGSKYNHITRKTETYLGEDRGNPYLFARTVIDAGADIVFGHGPHVLRAIDLYKDRFIAYSLGNFATYSRFNLSGLNGLAVIAKVTTDKEGKFVEAKLISAKQKGEGGPYPDETGAAYNEIKKLTNADIPEAPLQFLDGGKVVKK